MFDHGYALVIGVGGYQYMPHLDVLLTVADAQALGTVLQDPQFCGYPSDHITMLTDASAISVDILAALDELATRLEKQNTLLLFYSGHGHYGDDRTYYLTSHDTQLTENRKVLTGTAVSQKELISKLQRVATAHRRSHPPEKHADNTGAHRVDRRGHDGTSLSNQASLTVARIAASSPILPLAITPTSGSTAATFSIAYDGFASHERVSLWYHRPDGTGVELGQIQADAQGGVAYSKPATTLLAGRYLVVAYGHCSQVSAVSVLTVTTEQIVSDRPPVESRFLI